jgi:hypothetical protein
MAQWQWTSDLSDRFFTEGERIARLLGAKWIHLLRVMFLESGVRASQPNLHGSGAGGLIQFTPDTLRGLGYSGTPNEFLKLDAAEQLVWVRRYFLPYRGKLDTLVGVYCAVWMPADLAHRHDPSFVLSAKGGRRGWAYEGNAVLDVNSDLRITVGELEEAVRRACTGARWREIAARAGAPENGPEGTRTLDLGTTLGIQQALAALGFEPGPLDGLAGPRTESALRRFQRHVGLVVDGIPGPRTRDALARELEAAVSTWARDSR